MFIDKNLAKDSDIVVASSLGMLEDFKFEGHVHVTWEDIETGKSGVCHSDHNLIVNNGRESIVRLLRGNIAQGTTYHIDALKLGTQGHTGADTNNPEAPELTDTALDDTTSSLFTKALVVGDSTLKPTTPPHNILEFNIEILTTEANAPSGARTYTEAGLFSNYTNNTSTPANHIMFARQTFESVVKTNLRKLNFTWTISWS